MQNTTIEPSVEKEISNINREIKGMIRAGQLPSGDMCLSEYILIHRQRHNSVFAHLMDTCTQPQNFDICPMTLYILMEWDFVKQYVRQWHSTKTGTVFIEFNNTAFFYRRGDGSTKFNVTRKDPKRDDLENKLISSGITGMVHDNK